MNVKLLEQVKEHILAEPKRFDMDAYITFVGARSSAPPCGTTACIAGWAYLLTTKTMPTSKVEANGIYGTAANEAPDLLGISKIQSCLLFHTGNWPKTFREEFYRADTSKAEAEVAARRIEHFIKTKGRE